MRVRQTIASSLALIILACALAVTPAGARTTREYLSSFGDFSEVSGIAVDQETGNVYVTDKGTDEVDIFSENGGAPVAGIPARIPASSGILVGAYGPMGIAIDNSCYEHEPRLTGQACKEFDPSYGAIYVVDSGQRTNPGSFVGQLGIQKLTLNHNDEYEVIEELVTPNLKGGLFGVAVDSHGDVYAVGVIKNALVGYKKTVESVINGNGEEEVAERMEERVLPVSPDYGLEYVAVASPGLMYLSTANEGGVPVPGVIRLGFDEGTGDVSSEEVFTGLYGRGTARPVAVDANTGTVYIGSGPEIWEYAPDGTRQLTFGSAEPEQGSLDVGGAIGVAVNGAAERVYAANSVGHDIVMFGSKISSPVIPATQPGASDPTRTSVLLAGTANPESRRARYHFEYVAEGEYEPGATNPYRNGGRTASTSLTGGPITQTVERIALGGLTPGTTYHYRMVVENAAEAVYGPDLTFTTAPGTPPLAGTGPAEQVNATSATLTGIVEAHGLPTTYVFEVGADAGYGGARLYGNAGSSTAPVAVSAALEYLTPGATYHYRLTAISFDGTSYGEDGTFTTPTVPSAIVQPQGTLLMATTPMTFPTLTGAVIGPVGAVKARSLLAHELRLCRRQRNARHRAQCEARARARSYHQQKSKKRGKVK